MEKREARQDDSLHEFTAAEIGALAHLYRGEVYRSTIWRTRLDNTTNWAVAALGLAMSASFSHPEASPLPLVLIGVLIAVFMTFEARRYRYFNVWRARARRIETNFYAPMLQGQGCNPGKGWENVLAKDYMEPRHHISMARAIGRRLRRTYFWLLNIQALAYLGKIATPVTSIAENAGRWIRRKPTHPIATVSADPFFKTERTMTYVVDERCIKCKTTDCVAVCPVNCFYEGENMLVIHPDECIDCGVCQPECPVDAIKPDTEPGLEKWLELNREYAHEWPNITVKKDMPNDARAHWDEAGKFDKYFSPKPGQGD